MSGRILIAVSLVGLVLPAAAAAHGRGAAIALDHRLRLARATASLPGVEVRVLDGDRDFQVSVAPGVDLLVRGELGEPLLRIDPRGVFVNASSPTATSDSIVAASRRGWVQLSRGRSIAWHDHRLAPPPTTRVGPDGSFSIPIVLDGRPAAIAGTFFRVARPASWPWFALPPPLRSAPSASRAAPARAARARLTVGLGLAGGLAALACVTTFAARDAPSGGVAWLQIGTGLALGAVLAGVLVSLRGRARVHAAGVVGAIGAAVSLSSLSIFWHGVIISVLPAAAARLVCGLALVCGASAAVLSFLPDSERPLPAVRR